MLGHVKRTVKRIEQAIPDKVLRVKIERRNRRLYHLIERRRRSFKVAAYQLGISYGNARQIIRRIRLKVIGVTE